jgi:gluconate 2-dehydrogenase gamma chain
VKRREFLSMQIGAIGGTLLFTLTREPILLAPQSKNMRAPLRFFTPAEARVVIAACERILPRDERGPGATDAGVVIYIDRQLAGPYGHDRYRYTKGPFVDSGREHGYQGRESPREIYRQGIHALGDFADLSTDEQINRLSSIEHTRFFELLRAHTIEGMFCDPMHGGNRDLIGWQLIGFPGPQMNYRNDIDRHHGKLWRPKPASLQQITGHVGRPWEDEKA